MLIPVVFCHASRHSFSRSDLRAVLWNCVDLIHQFIPPVIVITGQEYYKLITTDPEYRAVTEDIADLRAAVLNADHLPVLPCLPRPYRFLLSV